MTIKDIRLQTGLSQSKFAKMFDIPIGTIKDWEQGRRTPPVYVENMIKTILEYKGMLISVDVIKSVEDRRKNVQKATTILLSATNGPDDSFMKIMESYISGDVSLDEIEERINRLEYLEEQK